MTKGRTDPARCRKCGEPIQYHGFHAEWFHGKTPTDRHHAEPPLDRSPGFAAKHRKPTP